jgi:hypothetical protein
MEMRPYWLDLEKSATPSGTNLGVGITAYSEEDARTIFANKFGSEQIVRVIRVIRTIDDIEQNHVRPNMGNLLVRGIWWPAIPKD